MLFKIYIYLFIITCAVNAVKNYNGFKLYKVIPNTKQEVDLLKELDENNVIHEIMDDDVNVGDNIKVIVAPERAEELIEMTKMFINDIDLVIEDIGKYNSYQQRSRSGSTKDAFLSFDWESYHNLDDINRWLDELQDAYPDTVKTVIMGKSVENRDIKGIIMNFQPQIQYPNIAVIEGTLHAREWISPATVTWIIKEFLSSTDPNVRAFAENFEWHIFPVVNPDGYVYSFTEDRLWRKNRNTSNFTTCPHVEATDDLDPDDRSNGVDLNRNFDFFWMESGASDDPCSNLFAGAGPNSEPETQAITSYIQNLRDQGEIIYYLSFHSFSQLVIVPYSHISNILEMNVSYNYADMYEIAIRSADKIKERYETQYRVGLSADVLYVMTGASFDWAKFQANIPISYLIELRDQGEYGFLLPEEQIIPNNLEVMDGLLEMDKTAKALGYYGAYVESASTINVLSLFILIASFIFHILN